MTSQRTPRGRRHRSVAALLPSLWPMLTEAADVPAATPLGPELLQTTIGLAIVLALIFGLAWLLRRVGPTGRGSGGVLRVVASHAVGQRERVVILEVGEQWLVLGVAPGRVNALQTLPRGAVPESAPAAASFSALLARATGKART